MNEDAGDLPEVPVPDLPDVTTADLTEILVALILVAGALVLSRVVVVVMTWITTRIAATTGNAALGEVLVAGLRAPTGVLISLQGLFIGLHVVSFLDAHEAVINRFWLATVLLTVAWASHRVVMRAFVWYMDRQPQARTSRVDPATIARVRTGVSATIVILAGVIALDALGLEVAPLIAGLGIGGLAVALALQPVLSNVFASSYLLSDSSIRVGDWVEIENGPTGLVQAIGFRATRIATFDNNVVLVPNSTLASTTFTNYSSMNRTADARVVVGVAYEEDLQRVEDVLVEELLALREQFAESVRDYEPLVLFQDFGDSNVDVLLKLRALTWLDSWVLRHEMIKRVHARLAREGITINYPARRLLMQERDTRGLERLSLRTEAERADVDSDAIDRRPGASLVHDERGDEPHARG